jgi:hypothetical protein
MTKKMSEASCDQAILEEMNFGRPKKGDRFHCEQCSMELRITADCDCQNSAQVHFYCCGEQMKKL